MTTNNKTAPRYEAVQGDYDGTTDNRRDRWYMQEVGGVADRRGAGYATQAEALDAIGMEEESEAYAIAFVNGVDGEWYCVHEIEAVTIEEANEAAAAWVAVHHPESIDDWYLCGVDGHHHKGERS